MPRSSLTAPSMVPGAFAGVSAACLRPPAALALGSARASDQDTGLRSPPDVASAWRGAQQAGVWAEQSRRTARCSKGPREAACPRPPEPPLVTTPVGAALAGRVWPLATAHRGCPRLPSARTSPPSPTLSAFHAHCVTLGSRCQGLRRHLPRPSWRSKGGASHACWGRLGSGACAHPGWPSAGPSCLKAGALVPWGPPRLRWEHSPPRTGWTLSVGQAGGTRPVRKGAVRGSESCRQRPRRAHGARDGDPALRPAVSRH